MSPGNGCLPQAPAAQGKCRRLGYSSAGARGLFRGKSNALRDGQLARRRSVAGGGRGAPAEGPDAGRKGGAIAECQGKGGTMKLLVLGGTVFVGRHLVERALARGHEVTLFHRGRRGAELHPQAARIRGERDGDLSALASGRWDAVVDTCGYVPRVVRRSVQALAPRAGFYLFVSSISVYADFAEAGLREEAALGELPRDTEEVDGETYGPLKALCEREVREGFEGRSAIVRPGLIVGPHDPTDRFSWWPWRVALGGEMLAPAPAERPVQVVDARDLGAWMLDLAERREAGVFHAAGPERPITLGELVECCGEALPERTGGPSPRGALARTAWMSEAFLLANGVAPWSDVPLWAPPDSPGLFRMDCARAIAAGLRFRDLGETVRDTQAWRASAAERERPFAAGLARERETELLRAWARC